MQFQESQSLKFNINLSKEYNKMYINIKNELIRLTSLEAYARFKLSGDIDRAIDDTIKLVKQNYVYTPQILDPEDDEMILNSINRQAILEYLNNVD